MYFKTLAPTASLLACVFAQRDAALQLKPENVQTASSGTGQGATVNQNQMESKTDAANFINYCSGKTLTNGQQVKTGSCNGIVMGDIPSQEKMVSTVILSPKTGENVPAKKPLTIQIQVAHLEPGKFTQPYSTYYTAPQQVGPSGQVQGHVHITVQNMGDSLTPTQPLDASKFVFFKGVNDVGDGKGRLSTTIPDGLDQGYYRVCTMTSAQNHQPVLMPVAQRGAQDDCTKFSVGIEAKTFKTDLRVVSDQDTTEKMFYRREAPPAVEGNQAAEEAAKKAEEEQKKAQEESQKQQAEAQKVAEENAKKAQEEAAKKMQEEAAKQAEATKQAEEAAKKQAEESTKAQEEARKQQEEAARKAAEEQAKTAEEARKRQEEAAKKAAEEQAKAAEEEAKKQKELRKQQEDARKQQEEAAKQQEEAAKKQAEEAKKAAEENAKKQEEAQKQQEEAAKKQAEEAKKAAEENAKKQDEAAKQQEEAAKKQAEEAKKQAEEAAKKGEQAPAAGNGTVTAGAERGNSTTTTAARRGVRSIERIWAA